MNAIIKMIRDARYFTKFVIVTRHQALLHHIERVIGINAHQIKHLEHASPEDVHNKHVLGILPLTLAAHAASVTDFPIEVSREDRGKEQAEPSYGDPCTYWVHNCDSDETPGIGTCCGGTPCIM
jgi:hypothetical protein